MSTKLIEVIGNSSVTATATVQDDNNRSILVITDNMRGTTVNVTPRQGNSIIVSTTGVQGTDGAQGPAGPAGPSGSVDLSNVQATGSFTGSFIGDGSGLTGVGGDPFPYTGSAIISGSLEVIGDAQITGSLDVNGIGGDIFLIKSSSFGVVSVEETGAVTLTNNAPTMFLIRNTSFAPILAVSQSGVVIFATQSAELTGTAPNGGLYFTSSSLFVGLD